MTVVLQKRPSCGLFLRYHFLERTEQGVLWPAYRRQPQVMKPAKTRLQSSATKSMPFTIALIYFKVVFMYVWLS